VSNLGRSVASAAATRPTPARPRQRGTAVLVATLALLLTGCGGQVAETDDTNPLTAQLAQYREDEVAHRIEVRVANTGTSAVTVTSLALEWPGLAPVPSQPDYTLRPGESATLPMDYSEATCSPGRTSPPSTRPVVRIGFTDDGDERTVQLAPLPDEGVLERIWTTDCRRQALDAAVDVTFGPIWTPTVVGGVPALRGTLELTRGTTAEPVSVASMSGSVLLDIAPVTPAPTPPLTMATGQSQASVPVAVVTTGRCDGHALGESKKPYDFIFQITVGSAPPSPATLTAEPAVKPLMLRTIEAGCKVAADQGWEQH
jgi:hypothetical protein